MKTATATASRQQNLPSSSRPRRHIFSIFSRASTKMPPIFNIIRACVYSAVLIWSIICLAIAVHFEGLLLTSDLTRFVPFAIFVCAAGLVIIVALLGFGLRKQSSPVSTRIELASLGLAGTLWIALGAFLATSESEGADVECFASSTSTVPLDSSSFSTDTYQAQYHVLEAFSLFNAILLWGFFIFLLCLAFYQHRLGEYQVWQIPVTAYPWFNRYTKSSGKLPAPVTARRTRSRGRTHEEKDVAGTSRRQPSQSRPQDRARTGWASQAPKPPAKARNTDKSTRRDRATHIHDKFARGASPRR